MGTAGNFQIFPLQVTSVLGRFLTLQLGAIQVIVLSLKGAVNTTVCVLKKDYTLETHPEHNRSPFLPLFVLRHVLLLLGNSLLLTTFVTFCHYFWLCLAPERFNFHF